MYRRPFRNNQIWIFLAAAIVLLSFLSVLHSEKKQGETLPVYATSDTVEETVRSDNSTPVDTKLYTDDTLGFSLRIPTNWQMVTKDGFTTFIHKASGASVQLQTSDYDLSPSLRTQDSASVETADAGYTFVSFNRIANNHYEWMYQDQKKSTYDYIDDTYWDTKHIITLHCVFNDSDYQKLTSYYKAILNSFSWDSDNAIPEGYYQYAFSDGFEIGVPDKWNVAVDGGVFYAEDHNGDSETFQVNSGYTGWLDTLSTVDAISLVSSNKNGFILESYQNEKEKAQLRYSYTSDGVSRKGITYLHADGVNLYALTFDYEDGMMEESVAETCDSLFQSFLKPDTTASSSQSSADSGNEAEQGQNTEQENNASQATSATPDVQESQTYPLAHHKKGATLLLKG